MHNITDILQKLKDATTPEKLAGTGETRLGILKDLFGARAGSTTAALIKSLDTIKQLRAELDHADGAAERMGAQGLTGLSASVKELNKAFEQLDIAIGEDAGFNKQIEWMSTKLKELLDWAGHGHPALLQLSGWAAMLGNALSAAAMPLLSLTILGPMAWNALKWTAVMSGTGLSAVAKGLWEVVAAARALVGLTGLGAIAAALATIYELSTRPGFAQKYLQEEKTDHDAVNALLKKFGIGGDTAAPSTSGGYIGGLSDAAKNLMSSGAQRILVELQAPHSIELNSNITVQGVVQGEGRGTATLPLNAITSQGEHAPSAGAPVAPGGR